MNLGWCRFSGLTALGAVAIWSTSINGANAQVAVQSWVQRYSGTGFGGLPDDYPEAMAVDRDGNVLVTGYATSTNGRYAFVTLKYSPDGTGLWTNRFDAGSNVYYYARALALDTNGNVFVTGDTYNGTYGEYLTLAYSSTGIPLWTNRFREAGNDSYLPKAIVIDSSGTVFVTGALPRGSGFYDLGTIAYTSSGMPLWTNLCKGHASPHTLVRGLAADNKGHVFVTGWAPNGTNIGLFFVTLAYSNSGSALWTNYFTGPAAAGPADLAVDNDHRVYVAGTSQRTNDSFSAEFVTLAYSDFGVPLWTNRYGSSYGNCSASAIAVGTNGNVIVTGRAFTGSSSDYATVAYSSGGVPLWTNLYDGPTNSSDTPSALAVDKNGNVFVTGESARFQGDYVTVAYSSMGLPLWTNRYDGVGGRTDHPIAVATDGSGNVFVTGYSARVSSSPANYDFATIKYSVLDPIPLAIQKLNNQAVVTWTNSSFGLQSSPAITATFTNIPGATSPYTNPPSGVLRFFRLISISN